MTRNRIRAKKRHGDLLNISPDVMGGKTTKFIKIKQADPNFHDLIILKRDIENCCSRKELYSGTAVGI